MNPLKHFIKDVGEVIAHAIKQRHIAATKETIEERIEICNACEFRQEEKCGKCGCILKYKMAFAAQTCPEKKWK